MVVFTAILVLQKSGVCCICIHAESVAVLLDACQRPLKLSASRVITSSELMVAPMHVISLGLAAQACDRCCSKFGRLASRFWGRMMFIVRIRRCPSSVDLLVAPRVREI